MDSIRSGSSAGAAATDSSSTQERKNHVASEDHRPRPLFAPSESGPLPERLISGNPAFKTWAQDVACGETIKTGIWEATPGETRSIKGDTFEFCHILSGIVELTPEGGEPVVYRAGDSFVMKPGYVGVWKTIETVRKIYVTVS
ncbi:cupin domain-containing protein [Streptomyces lomondensis]|uniref:cupin domain-containing protein n=1 Tax=Streptomyces lomondensis TaxID=68229 RepID=UPI0027E55899|nr:cupin domain-containing protein [Streptomyces lomondensis]